MSLRASDRISAARALLDSRDAIARRGRSRAGPGLTADAESLTLAGGLHEWFAATAGQNGVRRWHPPLATLLGLAWRVLDGPGAIAWIGRQAWPHPLALLRHDPPTIDRALLDRSLFIDPRTRDERVWALEQAARSDGIALVVADGSRLKMPESRRLQLAAQDRGRVVLLARPEHELAELSAARTRWLVRPEGEPGTQSWTVELLRCKGLQPAGGARHWLVRREHAFGSTSGHTISPAGSWQTRDGHPATEPDDRSASAHQAARIA